MRKFLLLVFAMVGFATLYADTQTVESSKFFDNWSLGLKGGGVTPLKGEGSMRGVVGIELQKNITPVWGLGVEGQWSINTSGWSRFPHSTTAFDHQLLGVYSTINLMNLFGGYKGTPRIFEINVNAGVGWLHAYMNNHKDLYKILGASSFNSWYTKIGPDFNFNLGKAKAWTIGLKPAFVYNMNYPGSTGYDIRHGYFEILAGVTYHFKNSNKTHSFTTHDDADYYYAIALLKDDNFHLAERVAYLENNPIVVEKVVEVTNDVVVAEPPVVNTFIGNAIGFEINSSKIPSTAYANLDNIVKILKENPELKLNIIGYASAKEGSQNYNLILSEHRSQNVKDQLVKMGIDADRLNVISKGSSSQPYPDNNAWNRVVLFEPVN